MKVLCDVAWPHLDAARGNRRPWRGLVDRLGAAAAIAMLTASWAQSPTEQNPAEPAMTETRGSGKETGSVSTPPAKEVLVATYAGAPYTYPSDVTVTKPGTHDFTAKDVHWAGEPFKSPIYYGVRIARWFEGGRTGTMLDFTHSKAIAEREREAEFHGTLNGKPAPARPKISDVFSKLEASHGHNMLTLNGLIRLPNLGLRLSPYAGIGAGVALPHSEVQLAGEDARTYEYQYAGPVVQALVGVELRLTRVSYFLEYKFTIARYEMPLSNQEGYILWTDLWRQLRHWLDGEAPPGGTLQTRFSSHQVIGGMGVRILAAPAAAVR